MKRFRFFASLVLAVVFAIGLTGPALAGELVPFKGRLAGDVSHTPVARKSGTFLTGCTSVRSRRVVRIPVAPRIRRANTSEQSWPGPGNRIS